MTVAFNGGSALTIKSNSGNDIAVGGLTAGMIVAGYVSGSTFRLLSDQTSSAFQAIIEGLVDDAEAAAAAAQAAASSVIPNTFSDKAAVEAYAPAIAPDFLITVGYNDPDDLGGASYANPVTVNPGKTDQIVITAGGTPTYYNRLHNAGEVDFAKHGMFLDGREEVTRFQDAFAVALDRGLKKLVMPGGKSLLLTEAVIPSGSFDVDFRGSTVLCDFNGAVAGASANAIRALGGTSNDFLILRGLDLNGQYNPLVTLTAENRILDVQGYGKFQLLDGWKLRNCGRGGTTELIIFDRSDKAISVHNCLEATVLDGTMRGNAKFEELVITSDNADCLATVMRVRGYDHISSGSPFNILNCAPGTTLAYCRAEGGYTGSGANFLTKHGRVIAN